jgi:hypothetical protein
VDANGKIEPVKFCWWQSVASCHKEAPWIANGKVVFEYHDHLPLYRRPRFTPARASIWCKWVKNSVCIFRWRALGMPSDLERVKRVNPSSFPGFPA